MSRTALYDALAYDLARDIVRQTTRAGAGHPSSSVSIAHILAYLFRERLRIDPAQPSLPTADRIVLSEGHAVPALYAALVQVGAHVGKPGEPTRALTAADLDTLRAVDSVLDGHPNPAEGVPWFDAATGSLGMGLSVAAGLGIGAKLDQLDRQIYCIIGDGESREGQIWEAVDAIVDRKLANVWVIMNANGHGQADAVSDQQSPAKLAAKLNAAGFTTKQINGHDGEAIASAFEELDAVTGPRAIVAETVKGWNVDLLLTGNWHGKPIPADKFEEVEASLATKRDALGVTVETQAPPTPPTSTPSVQRPSPNEVTFPSFADAMRVAGLEASLEKGKLSTRRAYGATLRAAGDVLPQLVVLDGDVSNSTFSNMFGGAFPERFIECKIAEQHMVSAGVGLSAAGFIPVTNTFAKFFARAYDQLELALISRANIKLVGSHSGVTPSSDGPSQMALADVAYCNAFTNVRADDRERPLLWFLQPADSVAAHGLTNALLEYHGACYMRTHRPDVPLLYAPDTAFPLGGIHTLKSGADIALVSSGYAIHLALEAREMLAQQGIQAAVIDVYSLPVNATDLVDALSSSGRTALCVEDNFAMGVGGAVASIAAEHGGIRVKSLHCQRMPKSSRQPAEMIEYVGVAPPQIADHARALLERP